ncbi:ABC transporter substrate-binding protein [Patescibacteria group bacterium]
MPLKSKIILIIVIILAIALIGYTFAQVSEQEKSVIRIGAALPLTGKMASFGEDMKYGFDLALREVNQNSKYQLRIIYEDTQAEADISVSTVTKLINIDQVPIILGPARSNNVLAVAPITEQNMVILFTPISSAEDISQAGDYVFRNRETAGYHGQVMAEFLKTKTDKIAVLIANSANSKTYGKSLIARFEELEGQVVYSTEYNDDATDFKTEILKAKNSGAEAFYLAVAADFDAAIIVRQIREMGFSGLITASMGVESPEFVEGAGQAAEGVIWTSAMLDDSHPEFENYKKNYQELAGKDSSVYAANAYDALHMLSQAIESCNGADTNCVRDYLYELKDYPGIGGKTSFDLNGDVAKDLFLKTVKDGKFIKYLNN